MFWFKKRKHDVEFNFTGWADSFSGNKIHFPIQCALYQEKGDCDWVIKTTVKGGKYVYDPHKISVIAVRQHASSYKEGKETKKYTTVSFKFKVDSYTKKNVYLAAKSALQRLENDKQKTQSNKSKKS